MLAMVGGTILALDRRSVLDQAQEPAERARGVGEANGVVVAYGDPATFYVPPFLPADAKLPLIDMRAAEPSAVWFALDGIEASLAQYPAGFVAKLIKAIFICGRMTFDGETGGGPHGPAWFGVFAPRGNRAEGITVT